MISEFREIDELHDQIKELKDQVKRVRAAHMNASDVAKQAMLDLAAANRRIADLEAEHKKTPDTEVPEVSS